MSCSCGQSVSPDVPPRGCYFCSGFWINEAGLIEARLQGEVFSSVVPAVRNTGLDAGVANEHLVLKASLTLHDAVLAMDKEQLALLSAANERIQYYKFHFENEAADAVALLTENKALQQRVEALKAALRKYGMHRHSSCHRYLSPMEGLPLEATVTEQVLPCDCGLSAALGAS